MDSEVSNAVAWYCELVAPGMRDHGSKLGPWFSKAEAEVFAHNGFEVRALARPQDEVAALRVQDWLLREYNECPPVQEIELAMRTPYLGEDMRPQTVELTTGAGNVVLEGEDEENHHGN